MVSPRRFLNRLGPDAERLIRRLETLFLGCQKNRNDSDSLGAICRADRVSLEKRVHWHDIDVKKHHGRHPPRPDSSAPWTSCPGVRCLTCPRPAIAP